MPTFGWVREGDWERYLTATEWPLDPSGPRPPAFACPICGHVYETGAALQAHVVDNHHVAPPIMVVAGREPRASHLVRRRLAPTDVVVANATSAMLRIDREDWVALTPSEIGQRLAGIGVATVMVRLTNASVRTAEPIVSEYRLPFHVAEAADLLRVEEAFHEHLTTEEIRRASVADFLADARCQAAGRDYAEGLAEYVLGVLVKEQSPNRVATPLERYRSHFGAALDRLAAHARPLPHLLCALMRFALNDFSQGATCTGYRELDLATAILTGPNATLPASPSGDGGLRRVCPVDHGTGRILDLAARLAREDRWGPVLRDECIQVATAATLDIADREKALALWALTAWRLDEPEGAAEPLARIASVYPFSSWARPCLDTVST